MAAQLHHLEAPGSDSDGPPPLISSSGSDGGSESDGGLPPEPIDVAPLQPIEMPDCSTLTSMIVDLAAVMVQRAGGPSGDMLASRMLLRVALEIASLDAEVERRLQHAVFERERWLAALRLLIVHGRKGTGKGLGNRHILSAVLGEIVGEQRWHAPTLHHGKGKASGKGEVTGTRRGSECPQS